MTVLSANLLQSFICMRLLFMPPVTATCPCGDVVLAMYQKGLAIKYDNLQLQWLRKRGWAVTWWQDIGKFYTHCRLHTQSTCVCSLTSEQHHHFSVSAEFSSSGHPSRSPHVCSQPWGWTTGQYGDWQNESGMEGLQRQVLQSIMVHLLASWKQLLYAVRYLDETFRMLAYKAWIIMGNNVWHAEYTQSPEVCCS